MSGDATLAQTATKNEKVSTPSPTPAIQGALTVTVLVPTYRRTNDLSRCLAAIARQTRPADEVLLVARDTDEETHHFLASARGIALIAALSPALRLIPVTVAGQVAALNAGLDAATCDVIAIVDDDAAPRLQWLERVVAHFARDARVGGVGGRDWPNHDPAQMRDARSVVGCVQWHGRVIGNHHLGVGAAREVDLLKGANMSYRREAIRNIRFDTRLKGNGSEINNDMAFSLAVQRAGWKNVYDPDVAVDHFPAQRHDEDQRGRFNAFATANVIHNETLTLLEHLPGAVRRSVFLWWAFLVGSRPAPGVAQIPRLIAARDRHALSRWRATLGGRIAGWRTFCESRRNQQSRRG